MRRRDRVVAELRSFVRDGDGSRFARVAGLLPTGEALAREFRVNARVVVRGWVKPGLVPDERGMRKRNPGFRVRVSRHIRTDVDGEVQDQFGFEIEATSKRAYSALDEPPTFRTRFVDDAGKERFPPASNKAASHALIRHEPQRRRLKLSRRKLRGLPGRIDEVAESAVPSRGTPHAWVVALLAEDPQALLAFADSAHGVPWRAAFVRILDALQLFRWADRYRLIESGLHGEFRSDLVPLSVERPRPHLMGRADGMLRLIPRRAGGMVEFVQGVEPMAVPDSRWLTVDDALMQDGGTVTSGDRLVCYEQAADPGLPFVSGVSESNFGAAAHPEAMLLARHQRADSEIREGILVGGRRDFSWHSWVAGYLPRVLTIPESVSADVPVLISGGTPSAGVEALRELTDRPIVMVDSQKSQPVGRLHLAAPVVQAFDIGSWDGVADIALDRVPLDAMRAHWNVSEPREGQGRRIFLHRPSTRRAVVNETDLVEVARRAGLEVIDSDGMTFAERRKLFGETEFLVGASGAVMANILMMRPGSTILAFTSEQMSAFVLPAALAAVAGCELKCLVGRSEATLTTDVNQWINADFHVDAKDFAAALAVMVTDLPSAVRPAGYGRSERRHRKPHVCLAAEANSPVEHLGAIARQARRIDLDVCWLAFPRQPETENAIWRYADPDAVVNKIPNEAVLAEHLQRSRSIAVWMQVLYPWAYPAWFWSTAKGLVAFANYGLTIDAVWNQGRYGLYTYRDAAWLVTEATAEKEAYIAYGVRPERIICAGNPLLAELRERDATVHNRTYDLLWAPHWMENSASFRGYSRWRAAAPQVLKYARENPESQVLVRPHPLLLPNVIQRLRADDVAAVAFRQLREQPNVTISVGTPLVDDIVASKAMISDGISIVAYWAATGRPLGITRDEESAPFNAAGEAILASADMLSTPDQITAWLDKLPDETVNEDRRALSARLHPTFDQSPIALWDEFRRRSRHARRAK